MQEVIIITHQSTIGETRVRRPGQVRRPMAFFRKLLITFHFLIFRGIRQTKKVALMQWGGYFSLWDRVIL